jgi:hypothetical protein
MDRIHLGYFQEGYSSCRSRDKTFLAQSKIDPTGTELNQKFMSSSNSFD